jgi:hypothetical protein
VELPTTSNGSAVGHCRDPDLRSARRVTHYYRDLAELSVRALEPTSCAHCSLGRARTAQRASKVIAAPADALDPSRVATFPAVQTMNATRWLRRFAADDVARESPSGSRDAAVPR